MHKFLYVFIAALTLVWSAPSLAERAALVIDADTGHVIAAKNANLVSFPASLTKLMTVYLLLEQIEKERIGLEDRLVVSAQAAYQKPVKLGLRPGDTITVKEAILALLLRSANDVAVVVAEAVAGSEANFAVLMNGKAIELDMRHTVFQNASGLPHPRQVTTARDMAILAQASQRDFPRYYHLFSARSFTYAGRSYPTINGFLPSYSGANGGKTGFTCKAGFNLVMSAERGGRRLIGVVLGEQTRAQRRARMASLLNAAFTANPTYGGKLTLESLASAPGQGNQNDLNEHIIADACRDKPKKTGAPAQIVVKRSSDEVTGWTVELARKHTKNEARAVASNATHGRFSFRNGRPIVIPLLGAETIYRACVTGLEQQDAIAACYSLHEKGGYCKVLNPRTATIALKLARSKQGPRLADSDGSSGSDGS